MKITPAGLARNTQFFGTTFRKATRLSRRFWLLSVLLGASCTEPQSSRDNVSDWVSSKTSSGNRVQQLVSRSGLTVLLLISPSECVACSTDMYRWVEYARKSNGHLILVLTREPNAGERSALAQLHLESQTIDESNAKFFRAKAPAVALFVDGRATIREDSITVARRVVLLDSANRLLSQK